MQGISFDDGVESALASLHSDRLALLAGAGLSMAPPSSLPAAARIAAAAKEKYEATYGNTREPLPADVEQQAEFFFQRGELSTYYFRKLIDQHAFAGQPNAGHLATADLLLVRAIDIVVTTNVDALIEAAGQQLFGQVEVTTDGTRLAALPLERPQLLKIHGCRTSDPDNMIWAPSQLATAPIAERIASSGRCLSVRLVDRDLLVVGYWSDWDYLNEVLAQTLGAIRPASVVVVDPCDPETFETKAPSLYALGTRASTAFRHVRASGADFLDALRLRYSQSFLRTVLHSGESAFFAQTGRAPESDWLEPPGIDNDALWRVRRDLQGCIPNEPATQRTPPTEPLLGLTILQLQAAGAVPDGNYWRLNGRRVRVLRAANKPLHSVEAEFQRETSPAVAAEVVIAVGAEAQALPSNFARPTPAPTIVRGTTSRWLTRPEAVQELQL